MFWFHFSANLLYTCGAVGWVFALLLKVTQMFTLWCDQKKNIIIDKAGDELSFKIMF